MLRCHDNDAAFIFSKFRVDGAFMASALVRQYGLEKSFRKYYSCKEKMLVEKCGLTLRIQKILDDGSFDDILRVQEKCIAINKSLQQFKVKGSQAKDYEADDDWWKKDSIRLRQQRGMGLQTVAAKSKTEIIQD
uniref:Uncharacterized protein n=1 Tax=Timema cristinae TaxID=61476 RepID=A0A7R9DAY6_TIMCR|nr:unnamed protein product [Timema cristinae]